MKRRDGRHGFTMPEMMIALAIMGTVSALAPRVLPLITQTFILGKTKIGLQEQARGAMYLLTRELRQAQSNTVAIDQISGQPYYSRISFTTIQGTRITVAQSGATATLTRGTVVTTLTKNLAYLTFTFPRSDDMTILSVSFTLQEQIYGGLFKALHMASEQVRVMN